MKGKTLRVGIAGFGVVGQRRRHCIDANPAFQTVAVSDVRFGSSGAAPDGVAMCAGWEELFEYDLDVLFVSLPTHLAAEVTIAGFERDLHVFCEKPPGRTVEDIRRVVDVERSRPHLKLKYGFNHRYHESVREAKELIE